MIDKIVSTDHHVSSGNAFADLGLPDPAKDMIRADLIHTVADIIRRRGLTQGEAAGILGVDQPKVSAILCGKISAFSTERLMKFLTALGHNVKIVVEAEQHEKGSISVDRA